MRRIDNHLHLLLPDYKERVKYDFHADLAFVCFSLLPRIFQTAEWILIIKISLDLSQNPL